MNDLTTTERVNVFKEMLHTSNTLLSDIGLSLSREYTDHSDILGTGFIFVYKNQKNNRTLEIHYGPKYKQIPDGFMFTVYNEKNKRLNVLQYLQVIGFLSEDKLHFCLDTYSGDFTEKMRHFFQLLNTVFQEETLKDILIGEKWVNLPFDWGGIK